MVHNRIARSRLTMIGRKHIFDRLREVCIACGVPRIDAEETEGECDGAVQYREWIIGMAWVREPIIPGDKRR